MAKVESDTIAAVREGRPIRDPKLEALRQFAAKITRKRGVVSEADVSAFKSTGHDNARCSIKRFRLALSLRAWGYFVARASPHSLFSYSALYASTPTPRSDSR